MARRQSYGARGNLRRPDEFGPRLFRRGRWYCVDLRPWGGGRPTVRDPDAPGWPERGERTDILEVADRWRWAYLEDAREGTRRRQLGLGPAPRKLSEATAAYLEHRQRTTSYSTTNNDGTALRVLMRFVGDVLTSRIDRSAVEGVFAELARMGYSPSTLRTYRAGMARFFAWVGGSNPVESIELRDPPAHDAVPWTDAEVAELRDAADRVDEAREWPPSARLMVELALATGARSRELYALEWRMFDPERHTVRFTRQLGDPVTTFAPLKSKRNRTTLVLPDWWQWYDAEADGLVLAGRHGRPLGFSSRYHLLQRVLEGARLNGPGVGYHRFRHTYARVFLEREGQVQHLQKSLGHASVTTTERVYEHLREDVAAALAGARIYGELGPKLAQ